MPAAWGWGSNRNNELAADITITCTDSEVPCSPIPLAVQGLPEATDLVSGGFHSLAPQDSGDLMTWGGNWEGQLGEGNLDWITRPVTRAIPGGVRAMMEGRTHSLALKADGTVWTWGANDCGQLGDGTTTGRTSPVRVEGLEGMGLVSTGAYFTLAGPGGTATTVYGYDQANRLKTASVGGTSSTYVYDGDGKRTGKTVASTTTNYTYDVNGSLPVLLDDGSRKYVWGLGLAFAVDTSGNPIIYHTDGLGSVRAVTPMAPSSTPTSTASAATSPQ